MTEAKPSQDNVPKESAHMSTQKFNQTLQDFSKDIQVLLGEDASAIIQSNLDDELAALLDKNDTTSPYLEEFHAHLKNLELDVSQKNEIIFSKEITILQCIDFHHLWKHSKITDDMKKNIWKYLHTMYLYADIHKSGHDLKDIIRRFKRFQRGHSQDGAPNQKDNVLFGILENLQNNKKREKPKDFKAPEGDSEDEDDAKASPSIFPGASGMPDLSSVAGNLLGGDIGKLATDIAKDIDPSTLDLGNPEELLKPLMEGKTPDLTASPIMGLVGKISQTLQSKFESGELDESKLMEEAKGMMSSFGIDENMDPREAMQKSTQHLAKQFVQKKKRRGKKWKRA